MEKKNKNQEINKKLEYIGLNLQEIPETSIQQRCCIGYQWIDKDIQCEWKYTSCCESIVSVAK